MDVVTLRPLGGLVGTVVGDEHGVVGRLLDTMDASLDEGAGWTVRRPGGLTWFPSRLALEVTEVVAGDEKALRSDVVVVRNVADASPELLLRLNDLNAHAAGWVYWFDPDDGVITATALCPIVQKSWWWCWVVLLLQQHQVTVAESIADELAQLAGGDVAVASHPQRGTRPEVDGWITVARLGSREPSASLDQFLTTLDYSLLLETVGSLVDGLKVEVFSPLRVDISNDGGLITQVRRHWHPEHGWGLQVATAVSGPDDATDLEDLDALVARAAERNTTLARGATSAVALGGWVAVRGHGLLHHTFVPATTLEHIASDAQTSYGAVLALVIAQLSESALADVRSGAQDSDAGERTSALFDAASELQLHVGPIGWCYLQDWEHQPDGIGDPEASWLVPRHFPICSFGLFNPIGPTVSSLEVAHVGSEWLLLFVLRNPFGPEIEEWGRASAGDDGHLAALIADALSVSDQGPMGPGPEWMDIFEHEDAVIEGVVRFAQASDSVNLAARGAELLHYSANPWARINRMDGQINLPERALSDPIGFWVDAITDREVVAGHQLFVRSAWEGSKALVAEGVDAAQWVSDSVSTKVRDRVLGDYSFRGEEGLLVQHPLTRWVP